MAYARPVSSVNNFVFFSVGERIYYYLYNLLRSIHRVSTHFGGLVEWHTFAMLWGIGCYVIMFSFLVFAFALLWLTFSPLPLQLFTVDFWALDDLLHYRLIMSLLLLNVESIVILLVLLIPAPFVHLRLGQATLLRNSLAGLLWPSWVFGVFLQ